MIKAQLAFEQELKFYSVDTNGTWNSTGLAIDLAPIPQGDAAGTRDGASVVIKRLQINGTFVVGDSTNVLRTICFWWHPDSTEEVPTATDVLSSAVTYSTILQLKPSKFTVVFDEMICVNTAESIRNFHHDIKLNRKIMFVPGANTGPGHLYIWSFSDSGAATHPTLGMMTTVSYTDS